MGLTFQQACLNFVQTMDKVEVSLSPVTIHVRLNFLFPEDGWGKTFYDDTKLSILKTLIQPFQISPLIETNQSFNDVVMIIFAVFNILIALIFLICGNKYQMIASFLQSIAVKYIYLLWHLFFVPQTYVFLQYINNDTSYLLYFAIVGLILLVLFLTMNTYFLRVRHFQPQKILQSKYSSIKLLWFYNDTLIIQFLSIEKNQFIMYIRQILMVVSGLFWLTELQFMKPYHPKLQKIGQFYGLLYLSASLIVTFLVQVNQDEQVFYLIILLTPLLNVLGERSLLKIKKFNQYSVIYSCQQLMLFDEEQSVIRWYLWVQSHNLRCSSRVCQEMVIKQHQSRNRFRRQLTRQLILCELQRILKTIKQYDLELIQLICIDFQKSQCRAQIPAYCQLKVYESNENKHSWYFRLCRSHINKEIIDEIKKFQKSSMLRTIDHGILGIEEIHKANRLQEKYIQKAIIVISEKIKFWKQLVQGHLSMVAYQNQTVALSRLIRSFKIDLTNDIDLSQQQEYIIILKLLSIYYSSIVNDFRKSQSVEMLIEDILKTNVNSINQVVLNDNLILLSTSVVRNRGLIMNKDRQQLANFFNYDDELKFNHIKHINQLMPEFVSKVHNQLIDSFMQSGKSELFHSERQVFFVEMSGFISMAQLRIDNFFESDDDYVLTAQLNKNKANAQVLLFDQFGQILGLTQEFHRVFDFRNSQYIFYYFPTLANFILEQKDQLMQGNEVLDKEIVYLNAYMKGFDSMFEQTSCNVKSLNNSQATFKKFDSNYNNKIIEVTEEGIPLFQKQYNQNINMVLRVSEVEKSRNDSSLFIVKFSLSLRVLGVGEKRVQFFTLELQDYKRRDFMQQTTGFESYQQRGTLVIQIQEDKSMSLDAEVSQVHSESIEKLKSSVFMPSITQQSHKKIARPNIELELDELSAAYDQSSRLHAPLSQRAQFKSMTNRQIEMDEELARFEDDFKQIFEIQQSSRLQLSAREQMESYRVSQTQRLNLLGYIDEENEEQEQEKAKSSSMLKHEKEKESAFKRIQKFKAEPDIVQSVNSSAKTSSSNVSIALVKRIQATEGLSSGLLRISIINGMLMATFFIFIIVNVLVAQGNHRQARENIVNIEAPYEYNKYYCKTFALSWVILQDQLEIVQYSQYIQDKITKELEDLRSFVLQELEELSGAFITISNEDSQINLEQIRLPTQYDIDFLHYKAIVQGLIEQVLSHNYESEVTEEYVYEILALKVNLANTITKTVHLIDSLVTIFLTELDDDKEEVLTTVLIEIALYILIIFGQLYYWRQTLNYKQRILLLIARLHEQDISRISNRLQLTRDILTKQSQISWKRANYFIITFVESTNIEAQVKQSSQNDNSKHRTVFLSSRIQSRFSLLLYTMMTIVVFLCVTLNTLGGYLLFASEQTIVLPTLELAAFFAKFSLEYDGIVASSMIMKSEYLVMPEIWKRDLITINKDQQMKYFSQPDDVIDTFNLLKDQYSKNTISILQDIVHNDQLRKEAKDHLYSLYTDDLCLIFSGEVTFCTQTPANSEAIDNNREYLRNGILGLYSQYEQFLKENFVVELETGQYNQNTQELMQTLKSGPYVQGVIEHFLDSQLAFDQFLLLIISDTQELMDDIITVMQIYYIVLGLALQVGLMIFFYIFIIKQNETIKLLRLGIVNIPFESLQDPQMISLLKQLDRE